jgi:hypothetical protein
MLLAWKEKEGGNIIDSRLGLSAALICDDSGRQKLDFRFVFSYHSVPAPGLNEANGS